MHLSDVQSFEALGETQNQLPGLIFDTVKRRGYLMLCMVLNGIDIVILIVYIYVMYAQYDISSTISSLRSWGLPRS